MIDTSRIEAMVAQLKAAAARAQGGVAPVEGVAAVAGAKSLRRAWICQRAEILAGSGQCRAKEIVGHVSKFSMGDDNVNLSDVMIAMQKASISFQTSIQVRNKLVSAYRDIMTMQV